MVEAIISEGWLYQLYQLYQSVSLHHACLTVSAVSGCISCITFLKRKLFVLYQLYQAVSVDTRGSTVSAVSVSCQPSVMDT